MFWPRPLYIAYIYLEDDCVGDIFLCLFANNNMHIKIAQVHMRVQVKTSYVA